LLASEFSEEIMKNCTMGRKLERARVQAREVAAIEYAIEYECELGAARPGLAAASP
jgi:hypothetical protein